MLKKICLLILRHVIFNYNWLQQISYLYKVLIKKLKENNKKNIVGIDSMEKFSCFPRYFNIDVILFFLMFFVI